MRLIHLSLPVTPSGEAELTAEVGCLERIYRDLAAESSGLPGQGGRSARGELEAIASQLTGLRHVLAGALLVGEADRIVAVGSEVTVDDGLGPRTLTISGPVAASPRRGLVSYEAPIARALLGCTVGDEVEYHEQGVTRRVQVLATQPGRIRFERAQTEREELASARLSAPGFG